MAEDHPIVSEVIYKDLSFLGFLGYRVGNDGSVWSLWIQVGRGPGCGCGCIRVLGKIWKRLKASPVGRNPVHFRVGLRDKECKKKFVYVHRLVLEAFVGPCPPGCETRHFPDRDTSNNNISNLSWSTHFQNVQDQIIHGTRARGERQHMCKLTDKKVISIRSEYSLGKTTQIKLALKYNVSRLTISSVICRKSWKYL